ncbi:peptidase C15, pyroglutamyl peptidase I-like protein [Eremomyces bilateralis CBS 781.70]|uniref:Peptidase C15, pyroglutamyl peptidase I-like protein n=1 Tax=Eremomyces bilateralis CBS 781.70 TaxID=1392243 RepID=A0A6G1FU93_9PEZI|nr:peptidase C15, pyroglutamyl peptidase I-like protein [Eremomyces bilateralis CBS 781.70]KAF1809344.1 peptidase C15, pyroglutamyl peptidase I-like protein [Eremomyces bilateralis CBS 781.70]
MMEDVEVVVTGYGPFRDLQENASFKIVSGLPDRIERYGERIRLRKYQSPIPVAYSAVLPLVPRLYRMYPKVEYFVHVGVAGEDVEYRVETRARKGPYEAKDVDGRYFKPPQTKEWAELPKEVHTSINVDRIVKALQHQKNLKIYVSDDAGLYLCEFIFYNSLVHSQRLSRDGRHVKGIFFHVPSGCSADLIRQGQDLLLQVIEEMVRLERRDKKTGKSSGARL